MIGLKIVDYPTAIIKNVNITFNLKNPAPAFIKSAF